MILDGIIAKNYHNGALGNVPPNQKSTLIKTICFERPKNDGSIFVFFEMSSDVNIDAVIDVDH